MNEKHRKIQTIDAKVVHEKNKKTEELLDLPRGSDVERVLLDNVSKENMAGTPSDVDIEGGTDPQGENSNAQMRQPSVCEAESFEAWHAEGKRPGHAEQGPGASTEGNSREHEETILSAESPLFRGKSDARQKGVSTLPTVQSGSDSGALPQKASLKANESGVLTGSSLEEQYRLATAYHRSGLMPAGLNSPEKVLVALQLCHELGLPPMSSIGKIAVINQTPSLFGDLPLALVMKSGKLDSIKETVETEGKDPVRAICTIHRKGMTDPIVREFTKDDAIRAGLWGKKVWAVYPKRMMQMRARSHAIKDAFPDVLSGVAVAEYDMSIDVEDATQPINANSRLSSLNERFAQPSLTNEQTSESEK